MHLLALLRRKLVFQLGFCGPLGQSFPKRLELFLDLFVRATKKPEEAFLIALHWIAVSAKLATWRIRGFEGFSVLQFFTNR